MSPIDPAIPSSSDPVWLRYAPLTAGILALIGLVVRAGGAFRYWINSDEGIYYLIAHMEWAEATMAIESNAHPPLFYLLMRVAAVFSTDHMALRVPSLIAGAVTIYLVFVFTRRIAGSTERPSQAAIAGLLAALLFTFAPSTIMLSQVARPYMTQLALVLGALIFLWRHAETTATRDLVGYAVTMMLALLFHYSTMLILGALGLVHLAALVLGRIPRERIKPLVLAQLPILAVVGYSITTHIARQLMGGHLQDEATGGWLRTFFLDHTLDAWPAFLGLGEYLAGEGRVVTPAIAILLAIVVSLRAPDLRLFGSVAVVGLGLAAVLSLLHLYPFGGHRHSFYLSALLFPLVAIGVVRISAKGRVAGPVLMVTLLTLAIADRRLAPWMGDDSARGTPYQELSVDMGQIEKLGDVLDQLRSRESVLIADMQTAYSLAPILNEPLQELDWTADGIAHDRFGKCTLVFLNVWAMQSGPTGFELRSHLGTLLGRLPQVLPGDVLRRGTNDVWLLSCSGVRLPNQIHTLGMALQPPRFLFDRDSFQAGTTYTFMRLDVEALIAACDEIARRR